jgi:hypothetical protein
LCSQLAASSPLERGNFEEDNEQNAVQNIHDELKELKRVTRQVKNFKTQKLVG